MDGSIASLLMHEIGHATNLEAQPYLGRSYCSIKYKIKWVESV